MHFKAVAVLTAQSVLDVFVRCLQPPPLLRFHVAQFHSTGSVLTCVFHSQRSAGLPYAKVTPWLWIGSTMFVLIGRLPPSPTTTTPLATTAACRLAAREADEGSLIAAALLLCPCARLRHNWVPQSVWPVHTSDYLTWVFFFLREGAAAGQCEPPPVGPAATQCKALLLLSGEASWTAYAASLLPTPLSCFHVAPFLFSLPTPTVTFDPNYTSCLLC